MNSPQTIRNLITALESIESEPQVTESQESIRQQIKDVSDKIDKIVQSGGRVALNDPLSKKLKHLKSQLKSQK